MVDWSEYYKNNKDKIKENQESYKEKIKNEKELSDSEYNYYYREQTAKKRGMTTSEYNSYLEERRARRLGITVKELRHFTYISKKTKTPLYECIGISEEEYKQKLKNK